ncbi:SpoIIE family protein phosphatase [Paludibacterium yongneupense]|uniref:SpoIIE family protein phosphatase n=1 Tax=Paludibacterium yongneupense TaxID=400061 RepID=UPI00041524A2|nr:SpoIIE family protein phosphatase [Paludibacterium yongneupense]
MTILARVGEALRERILADDWLALFDWDFTGSGGGEPELMVLESPLPEDAVLAAAAACPVWRFGCPAGEAWPAVAGVSCLAVALDPDLLGDRLLAWCWSQGRLAPACLGMRALSLLNGSMSLLRPQHPALQMAVLPALDRGGDVALCVDRGERTLVVLADAIGHGDDAAFDAALFVVGLSVRVLPCGLSRKTVADLNRYLKRQLAWGRFVAAAMIEIDWSAHSLVLVNAGMPDILCIGPDVILDRVSSMAPPLGLAAISSLPLVRGVHSPGEVWVLSSDGVDVAELLRKLWACHWSRCGCGPDLAVQRLSDVVDDASHIILGNPLAP